jgi:hypothetical protein
MAERARKREAAQAAAPQAAPAPAEPSAEEAKPAHAPKQTRRTAERSRTHEPAPAAPVDNPEQPSSAQSSSAQSMGRSAQSTRDTSRAFSQSGRNRYGTEQRQSEQQRQGEQRQSEQRQSWSDSKRKSGQSRREYVERDEGLPEGGVIVRRYEGSGNGAPFVTTRRQRGEQDRPRGWEQERPGYANREPSPFGYRDDQPRFGVFDWLFR